jgi:hypothetical protein
MPKIDDEKWKSFQGGFRKATGADDEPAPQDKDSDEDDKTHGKAAQVLIAAKTSVRKMFGM